MPRCQELVSPIFSALAAGVGGKLGKMLPGAAGAGGREAAKDWPTIRHWRRRPNRPRGIQISGGGRSPNAGAGQPSSELTETALCRDEIPVGDDPVAAIGLGCVEGTICLPDQGDDILAGVRVGVGRHPRGRGNAKRLPLARGVIAG